MVDFAFKQRWLNWGAEKKDQDVAETTKHNIQHNNPSTNGTHQPQKIPFGTELVNAKIHAIFNFRCGELGKHRFVEAKTRVQSPDPPFYRESVSVKKAFFSLQKA